ncbi:STAS domain-containing protein [Micromonospora sp. STR1_7]|uniref:STAS domain-containing protein n=1 Tax=Micromonospora parastrephiae TaxID=2806101 RepID=A0ABS1XPW5_9ACTN|nr:STAS domain-containing protein [Micromonospora parastrephiae]MBM0231289.1 STAS domain-containing protein [Micromonospora parastrephiae]
MTDQFPDLRPSPPDVRTPIMSLALTRDGSTSLISVAGEIDMSNAHLLTELVEFLCRTPVPLIALDLSAVRFLGAHGVTALLQASKLTTTAGARLTVRAPSPFVLRVLGVAGVLPHLNLDGAPRASGAALTDVVWRTARPRPARTSTDRVA